uniref:Uncharacterized protein n=1 Tax=viral metagenome TaxID=1070528 RepID=A0A6C0I176_9ZZZZ
MNKSVGDVVKDIKSIQIKNLFNKSHSSVAQIALGLGIIYACLCHSNIMQHYYNSIAGRILIILIISISCSYKYTLFVIIFIICIFLNSFKTYEGFSLTDIDSITSSIKNNLPASMVSLPANPTPQDIYDYLNKQICTAGNADIYSQIYQSTSSSDDAKLLAMTALGFNGEMCKKGAGATFYQNPQALFDDFKNNTCASNPNLPYSTKKLIALSSSITADSTSSNVFSAPLIAIANWISTTQSAICGAAATPATTTPAATTTPS